MIESNIKIILLDKGPCEVDVLGFVNCGHAKEELTHHRRTFKVKGLERYLSCW
jgi:hypothetical protein